jgi:hypothetical protein
LPPTTPSGKPRSGRHRRRRTADRLAGVLGERRLRLVEREPAPGPAAPGAPADDVLDRGRLPTPGSERASSPNSRERGSDGEPGVYMTMVTVRDVLAYFQDRNEQEIVDPDPLGAIDGFAPNGPRPESVRCARTRIVAQSGRRDLNPGPPVPQTGTLTRLRHAPSERHPSGLLSQQSSPTPTRRSEAAGGSPAPKLSIAGTPSGLNPLTSVARFG